VLLLLLTDAPSPPQHVGEYSGRCQFPSKHEFMAQHQDACCLRGDTSMIQILTFINLIDQYWSTG
jgi:hypothetical protein